MKILHRLSYLVVVPLSIILFIIVIVFWRVFCLGRWIINGNGFNPDEQIFYRFDYFVDWLDKKYPL